MKNWNSDFQDFQLITTALPDNFKTKMLYHGVKHRACSYFTNNNIAYPQEPFEELMAIGIQKEVHFSENTFEALQQFHDFHQDWLFGYLSYDLKNEIEELTSNNPDPLNFPKAVFYIPKHIIRFKEHQVYIKSARADELIQDILQEDIPIPYQRMNPQRSTRVTKQDYLQQIEKIHEHIRNGDVYELNYCIQNFKKASELDPVYTFLQLNHTSPMPFAAFQKYEHLFAMCASPERFMKKEGSKLICQPIKGTTKRGQTPQEDERLRQELGHSEKERAENMMIVDLVRNDLARSAQIGSVKVEEIFGVYTFETNGAY